MRKLTENNAVSAKSVRDSFPLLLSALKTTGNLKDAYLYIEEMLTSKVADEINAFLGFIHQNKEGKVGFGNIESHYIEFRLTTKQSHRNHWFITDILKEKKTSQKVKVIKKDDEVYVLRDALDSFQGKHKVVSVNKQNNTITIQLGKDFQVE